MKEKIAIVNEMVKNGYHLFNETPEHFANRFDLHVLEYFKENFTKSNKRA